MPQQLVTPRQETLLATLRDLLAGPGFDTEPTLFTREVMDILGVLSL